MVVVAQLVRASDCGSEGRRFETGLPPKNSLEIRSFFISTLLFYIKNSILIAFGYVFYTIIQRFFP